MTTPDESYLQKIREIMLNAASQVGSAFKHTGDVTVETLLKLMGEAKGSLDNDLQKLYAKNAALVNPRKNLGRNRPGPDDNIPTNRNR